MRSTQGLVSISAKCWRAIVTGGIEENIWKDAKIDERDVMTGMK